MLILRPSNSGLKRLINIQKCRSSTKLDHCAFHTKGRSLNRIFSSSERIEKKNRINDIYLSQKIGMLKSFAKIVAIAK